MHPYIQDKNMIDIFNIELSSGTVFALYCLLVFILLYILLFVGENKIDDIHANVMYQHALFIKFVDEKEMASTKTNNTISKKGTRMSSSNSGCGNGSVCINQFDLVDPAKQLTTKGINLLRQWALGRVATKSAQGKNSDMEKRILRLISRYREIRKDLAESDNGNDLLDEFSSAVGELNSLLSRHIVYLKKHGMPKRAKEWSGHLDKMVALMDEYAQLIND